MGSQITVDVTRKREMVREAGALELRLERSGFEVEHFATNYSSKQNDFCLEIERFQNLANLAEKSMQALFRLQE